MKRISYVLLLLALSCLQAVAQTNAEDGAKPIKVNFCAGNVTSTNSEWNNFTGTSSGSSLVLKDIEGNATNVTMTLKTTFNGTNTEGVQTTTTPLGMTSKESYSAFWAQALNSNGTANKSQAGFVISGLDANCSYDFIVFGSRKNQTDNRETSYLFIGQNEKEGLLNCSSNATEVATVTGVIPDSNGEIELVVSPGSNNNNSVRYYYINTMQITPRPSGSVIEEPAIVNGTTVNVNFCAGNVTATDSHWNNYTNPTSENAVVLALNDINGKATGATISLNDAFNATNTEGVQATTTALNMPADVSKSAFYGYAAGTFGSSPQQPTAGFVFSGLNKSLLYDISVFGSRKNVSDNRDTKYEIIGAETASVVLSCSNNASDLAEFTDIHPDENGEIKIVCSPGENNNNANKFYFINALQLKAHKEEIVEPEPLRVLAIGNSFSEDAVEQYLYNLAAEEGLELVIGNAYRGGQGLNSHWNDIQNNTNTFEYRKIVKGSRTNTTGQALSTIITDEPWDIVTFQQVSQDSGRPDTYEPYLGNLIDFLLGLTTNPNVKVGMHQTWAYAQNSTHSGFANYDNNQLTMYKAIVNAVNQAVANHDELTFVIPSGTAIQNARTSILGDNLNRDGYHLDYGIGRYIAACTWLEAVTELSAVGKNYHPSSIDNLMATIGQNAAHNAILNPNSVTDMSNEGYDGDNAIIPSDVVKVNFGASVVSAPAWNSITPGNKMIASLKDASGGATEIAMVLSDDFNGTNTSGASSTTTVLDMPSDVSKSCLWGYALGNFENQAQQPTGGFAISHLNKNLAYDFTFFGSRNGSSDNRETAYKLTGKYTHTGYLDAASNSTNTVTVKNVRPNDNGQILLTVSPGEENKNVNRFYYINAMQIEGYESTPSSEVIEISTAEDLLAIEPDGNYILTNDIDLSGVNLRSGIAESFYGSLDGAGHVLRGIKIDKSSSNAIGLFRHLYGATIKNLGIEESTVSGRQAVGMLAGQSHGSTIEGCYIINSAINGYDHVASFVGQLEAWRGTPSLINNCYAATNVYSSSYQGGGIVGTTTGGGGQVSNSYFAGRVEVVNQRASGIVALQDTNDRLTIENCLSAAVELVCPETYRVASVRSGYSTMTNNYALSTLTSTGGTEAERGIDASEEELHQQAFYADGLTWTFGADGWQWHEGTYPLLGWQQAAVASTALVYLSQLRPVLTLKSGDQIDLSQYYISGNGAQLTYTTSSDKISINGSVVTMADGIEITNIEDVTVYARAANLQPVGITLSLVPGVIAIRSAEEFSTKVAAYPSGDYVLANDVDFSSVSYAGVNNFTGTFDGQGHVVTGLTMNNQSASSLGLFNSATNATIKNLGIEGANINGADNTGVLVGIADGGTITNCYVSDSRVEGGDRVAGIAGRASAGINISNCYVTGTNVIARTHQAAGIVAASFNGGVDIENCYFDGTIKSQYGNVAAILGLDDRDGPVVVKNCVCLATSIAGGTRSRIANWGSRASQCTFENNYALGSTQATGGSWAGNDERNGTTFSNDADATTAVFYKETLGWNFATVWKMSDAYPVFRAVGEVVVSPVGYATYVTEKDIDFENSSVEAFAVTASTVEGHVHLTPIAAAPAGEAVLIKAEAGAYILPTASTAPAPLVGNLLKPAFTDVVADGTQYILAEGTDGVAFYQATSGTTIFAGKAYLEYAGSNSVKSFTFIFDNEDPTAIDEIINRQSSNRKCYNLAGQMVNGTLLKGLYIIDKMKILRKKNN